MYSIMQFVLFNPQIIVCYTMCGLLYMHNLINVLLILSHVGSSSSFHLPWSHTMTLFLPRSKCFLSHWIVRLSPWDNIPDTWSEFSMLYEQGSESLIFFSGEKMSVNSSFTLNRENFNFTLIAIKMKEANF